SAAVQASMACLFCRRKIGPVRRFVDANFCCADHRQKYRTRSARALREAEDLYGTDEEWDSRWKLYASEPDKKQASQSQSSAFVVAVAVAFLLFAITRDPADGSPPPSRSNDSSSHSTSSGGFQRRIGEAIEKRAPVTIRESFSAGLNKWDSLSAVANDWVFDGSYVHPHSLRVW